MHKPVRKKSTSNLPNNRLADHLLATNATILMLYLVISGANSNKEKVGVSGHF